MVGLLRLDDIVILSNFFWNAQYGALILQIYDFLYNIRIKNPDFNIFNVKIRKKPYQDKSNA